MNLEKYFDIFAEEAEEYLERAMDLLTADHSDDQGAAMIDELFRCFHSIKGMAAGMGFEEMSRAAHSAEDLLHPVRDGKTPLDKGALLTRTDEVQRHLQRLVERQRSGQRDDETCTNRPGASSSEEVEEQGSCGQAASPELSPNLLPKTARICVAQLDSLLAGVGEMTFESSSVLEKLAGCDDPSLIYAAQRLSYAARVIHSSLVAIRMLPFNAISGALYAACDEASDKLGKQVRLTITGDGIRLDRTVLETLVDPLNHLLRNAMDHGIESSAVRKEAGKPARGRIVLTLTRKQDSVLIMIEDDGAGIDPDKVRQRAVEQGFVSREQALGLTEPEALKLIALPGFSQKTTVTQMSGRGVGLDAVFRRIESVGGKVEISTRRGAGTTITLRVPLSAVMIDALLIQTAGQTFAVPLGRIEQILPVAPKDLVYEQGIRKLQTGAGRLPVYSLWELVSRSAPAPRRGVPEGQGMLVRRFGERSGILIGGVISHREVLVKPLAPPFNDIPGFTGATVLSDGRPALILDPEALLEAAG